MSDGTGLNGCYASHIVLRAGTEILAVPETLPDSVATPANCAMATIVNALETLPEPCERALVQGGGLLGLYACAWLRHRGVRGVLHGSSIRNGSPAVAEFGGTPVRPDTTLPRWISSSKSPASAAVIPAGSERCARAVRTCGREWCIPRPRSQLTGEAVIRKCLTIRGVHNYAPRHLATSLAFLAEHHTRLPFENLVSPPIPLDRLNDALE